jgi:hypothetical protein
MPPRRRPLNLRLDTVDGAPVAWLDVDRHPVWRVSGCLVAQGRRPVLRELRVSLKPGVELPSGGLPAGVVSLPAFAGQHEREPGFAGVLASRVGLITAYWAPAGTRLRPGLRGLERVFPFLVGGVAPKRYAWADRRHKRPGRPPLTDDELLRASVAYVEALEDGSRRPVADAAARLSQTALRMRDLLNTARERGLLTRPLPGRPSGKLTPRARALLRTRTRRPRR